MLKMMRCQINQQKIENCIKKKNTTMQSCKFPCCESCAFFSRVLACTDLFTILSRSSLIVKSLSDA